jgi:malonate transporter and related proteins
MDSILFTLNVVLPVFVMILTGKILKRIKVIDDNFISKSSDLVFKLALPALIFQEVSNLKLSDLAIGGELIFTFVHLTLVFSLCMIFGMIFIKDRRKVGVFAQAVFRGNYGIIALALLSNMFGSKGLTMGAIILSIATICYNTYSTIGLIIPQQKMSFASVRHMLFKIATNPIIIGVILAFVLLAVKNVYTEFALPVFVSSSIRSFASLSLPIALIGIGGSISFHHIRHNKNILLLITALRTVILPLIFTIIAVQLGFRNESLAGLYLLFGVPTATASFVLARSMKGDHELAANAVALTTAASVVTISSGIFILKFLHLL